MITSRIQGTGAYLPEKVLTNKDLEKIVETSNEWILERTGIHSRHIASAEQATSDLAKIASERALESAGLSAKDIDAIIFATVTPDQIMPSAACVLQAKLGCRPILAFDLSAACSGFLYSLTVADSLIKTGLYKNILVVGAECLSRIVDYDDRSTCILFGDAAGAFILSANSEGAAATGRSSILSHHMSADGTLGELLTLPGGGSKFPASHKTVDEKMHFVKMQGREIFKSAVRAMAGSSQETLTRAGLTLKDVDWMIPHQANTRIIRAVGDLLGIPSEKVIVNIENMGNTSSATIPVAFDESVRSGKIERGQTVLLCAFGGGLTSGSLAFRY